MREFEKSAKIYFN